MAGRARPRQEHEFAAGGRPGPAVPGAVFLAKPPLAQTQRAGRTPMAHRDHLLIGFRHIAQSQQSGKDGEVAGQEPGEEEPVAAARARCRRR